MQIHHILHRLHAPEEDEETDVGMAAASGMPYGDVSDGDEAAGDADQWYEEDEEALSEIEGLPESQLHQQGERDASSARLQTLLQAVSLSQIVCIMCTIIIADHNVTCITIASIRSPM